MLHHVVHHEFRDAAADARRVKLRCSLVPRRLRAARRPAHRRVGLSPRRVADWRSYALQTAARDHDRVEAREARASSSTTRARCSTRCRWRWWRWRRRSTANEVDVVIIDGRLERDPVAAVVAAADGALCLGITVLTGAPIHDALAVSRAVKAAHPACPVVWGGWHPSLFADECLDEPAVDVAVIGQGEDTFASIWSSRLARG